MRSIPRHRALGGGVALFSLVLSIIMMLGLFAGNAAISIAQTDGDHDKIAIRKVANAGTVNAGDTVTFTITVTTQPFPIDGVVLTDTLPTGITGNWTVGGADAVAAGCPGIYAPGALLTCNFGTLGDFGVVVNKTVTVSGQTSVANCPILNNTAHVAVAASEEETLLANNTSTASVNVICATATPTKTPVPPTATPVPPSPTPTPPSARIVPTGTTCAQFKNGTAADLNAILYGVRSGGSIGNVAPGIGFYFVALPGTGSYSINQSDTASTPAFGVQSVQIYFAGTFTLDSAAEATISTNAAGTSTSFSVSGAHIVRLAFDPNTVVGSTAPSPSTVTYTYSTAGVANSTDTIGLAPKP